MDIFDTLDDTAIEEEALMYDYLNQSARKEKIVRPRVDHFKEWDSAEFHRRLRLITESVEYLLFLVKDETETKTQRNQYISPMLQLLITLRFSATGKFLCLYL
ncbi:hypothetical protein ACJJTC_008557 [Scirpophaga incertulas]